MTTSRHIKAIKQLFTDNSTYTCSICMSVIVESPAKPSGRLVVNIDG
jgi:hypothetical protein